MCKICQSVSCRLIQQRLVQEMVVKSISHSFTALSCEKKFVSMCEHAISPINNNNDNDTKDLWPLAMAHSFGIMLA